MGSEPSILTAGPMLFTVTATFISSNYLPGFIHMHAHIQLYYIIHRAWYSALPTPTYHIKHVYMFPPSV